MVVALVLIVRVVDVVDELFGSRGMPRIIFLVEDLRAKLLLSF